MARKKKLEEDAWLWMSRPVVPGMVSIHQHDSSHYHGGPATVTITYPGKPIKEMPIEGFTRAMFEYAAVAALDPTNIPEGAVWAAGFGISYRWGLLFAVGKGILVGAPLLAIIDPQDRWEGGLDETRAYQAGVGGVPGAHPNLNKQILMGAGSWGSVV
jgi:hypothetical protein